MNDWRSALIRLVPSTAMRLTGKADMQTDCPFKAPDTGYAVARVGNSASGVTGVPSAKRIATPASATRKAWRKATIAGTGDTRIVAPSGKVYAPLTDGQAIDASRCGILSPDTSVACGTYYKPYRVARYSQRMQTSRKVAATKVDYQVRYRDVRIVDLGTKVQGAAPLGTIAVAVDRIVTEDASVKATLGVNTSAGIAGATSQAECNRARRKAQGAAAADTFFAGL